MFDTRTDTKAHTSEHPQTSQGWADTMGAPHPPQKAIFTPLEIPPEQGSCSRACSPALRSKVAQGTMLQGQDLPPCPAARTAPSRFPGIRGLLLHVDNLFNGAINSNLRSWLEDIPAPQPGVPSGMEPRFVSYSPTGHG